MIDLFRTELAEHYYMEMVDKPQYKQAQCMKQALIFPILPLRAKLTW